MFLKVSVLTVVVAGALGAVVRPDPLCPLYCDLNPSQPLCGSDGVTYDNQCYLRQAMCQDPTLRFSHEGPCKMRRGIICTTPWCWPRDDFVCGSDGTTYRNQCELNNAMCENESLKTEYHGPCTATRTYR